MSHERVPAVVPGTQGDREPSTADVRACLEGVLQGQEFRASKRCQDFLRYVVDATLHGKSDTLKERTIAMEVFGCGDEYDPGDNAIVRVRAGEVRKRLERHYAHEGVADPVEIVLRPGTYVPEFRVRKLEPVVPDPTKSAPVTSRSHTRTYRTLMVLGLAIVVAAGYAVWRERSSRRSPSAMEQFWAPVLTARVPIRIFAASVPVYSLNRDPGSSQPVSVHDFVLIPDQYVGVSDVNATNRVSEMLTRMHHPYAVRIGGRLSFEEIRGQPAVLVGYTYTRWRELSSGFRYFIHADAPPFGIQDQGMETAWKLSTLPNSPVLSEDYAVISRVFDPDTHAMLVEISGISHFGTEAAADLVTNPDLFTDGMRGATPGWQNKNVQIVIHTRVIDGVASAPQVLSVYVW